MNVAVQPKPLLYPNGLRWSPPQGEPFEVAPDVFWLRMPLPMALDHINLWLLRDGDGWTIVDTGVDAPVCKEVWERVFAEFARPETIKRIVVTHFHPDHIGLAAWLAARCNVTVYISDGEMQWYRRIIERPQGEAKSRTLDYLNQVNCPDPLREKLSTFFKVDEKPAEDRLQWAQVKPLAEGDTLEINGEHWRIVVGNGHSPEHCCLYNEARGVLISGDQAIPRISSNVSVTFANLDQDPLGDWLDSCQKLQREIPNDTLILPSHQEPFVGIHQRMQAMIDDHEAQLDGLLMALKERPLTVDACRAVLFNRELNTIDMMLATGETMAHLNYLLHRDLASKSIDEQGVAHFKATKNC